MNWITEATPLFPLSVKVKGPSLWGMLKVAWKLDKMDFVHGACNPSSQTACFNILEVSRLIWIPVQGPVSYRSYINKQGQATGLSTLMFCPTELLRYNEVQSTWGDGGFIVYARRVIQRWGGYKGVRGWDFPLL